MNEFWNEMRQERDALRAKVAAMTADLGNVLERALRGTAERDDSDPPICRLQFPDGTVPANAREAAEGWNRHYDLLREELNEVRMDLMHANNNRWQLRKELAESTAEADRDAAQATLAMQESDRAQLRLTNATLREELGKINKWHHDSRAKVVTLERDNDVLRSSTAELMIERDAARARGAALLAAVDRAFEEYHVQPNILGHDLRRAIETYRKGTT